MGWGHKLWAGARRYSVMSVAVLSLMSSELSAAGASFFALDAGPYVTQVDRRLAAVPGYAGRVSTLAAFLRARRGVSLSTSWNWEPSLGMLLPWRSGADGFAKTFMIQASLPIGYSPWSWLHFRAGPGVLWRLTLTNSEAVSLNNGNGTSTFYIPGGSKSVVLLTVDAGLELRVSQTVSLNFDVWVSEIANTQRRTFNAAMTLGFYL